MSSIVGIYGATGHGRDLVSIAQRAFGTQHKLVFIDDAYEGPMSLGLAVLRFQSFVEIADAPKRVVVAVSNGTVRKKLVERCNEHGLDVIGLTAESALVSSFAEKSVGAVIGEQTIVSAGVTVGAHFQANNQCNIAHDVRIGDFVTFGPGVKCSGCTEIGDFAYIGAGALIKQGDPNTPRRIGANATIGMGAVVIHDVPPGVTVVGNPARPIS